MTSASENLSGWYGPAYVADISRITRGLVSLKFQGEITEVQIHTVRRHLHFPNSLAGCNQLHPPLSKVGADVGESHQAAPDCINPIHGQQTRIYFRTFD